MSGSGYLHVDPSEDHDLVAGEAVFEPGACLLGHGIVVVIGQLGDDDVSGFEPQNLD